MEHWESIRRRVLVEHESKRQILRETGMHCCLIVLRGLNRSGEESVVWKSDKQHGH